MWKPLIVAALALSLVACQTPIVSTPRAACADLVPSEWAQGVEAAPVPNDAPVTFGQPISPAMVALIIGPWAAAYVATSAALEKANGRTASAMDIVRQCEAKVNKARP